MKEGNKCIDQIINVQMITNRGEVVLQLDGKSAPLTSTNFLSLVDRSLYDGSYFNNVIKDPFPYIVRGGYQGHKYNLDLDAKLENQSYINNKSIALKNIPLEIKIRGEDIPRYNELIFMSDDFKRIVLTHRRGSLSMARSIGLNSANMEFNIALKDLPELDGRYSVFGKVVKGMNVIDLIEEGDVILSIKRIRN
ncbi:Peptidyl-prolyl cis-trans isomerase [Prochlorococcus sp. MIT 0602]|nr:Peptidyl-prolyl cis-trans isomerase [Prochlorococcus sp. MIT 0602]